MSVFRKRSLLIAIATVVIGVGACAAIWGVPRYLKRSTSVTSQVTAYLLDDRGEINGLLLSNGDQLHFSPQTGAVVGAQIKVGDEVTASGHPGSQSTYGREVRVEQISANGRKIVEADAGHPRKHQRRDKRGPDDRGDRESGPAPPDARTPGGTEVGAGGATTEQTNRAPGNDPNAKQTENALPAPAPSPAPSPEISKATGTIRTHLVNGHGDVVGLILSSGEQVRFSPKVGKLIVAAEQGATTQVSVEGTVVRNERGTVIRPAQIAVGNQTITLAR